MPCFRPLALLLAVALAIADAGATNTSRLDPMTEALARSAPALDRGVLDLAARAMSCALRQPGAALRPRTLSVIDFSRPSTEPRLWVFDLERPGLLFEEWVAHGRNTGGNMATAFSNRSGSYMSSLGGFQTQETYVGANGYSLRLRGLEPGFNDLARERAIVIHGAPYVNPLVAGTQGRLGRSLGCPAVRPAVARELIDSISDGSFMFAYFPDEEWLEKSALLADDCGTLQQAMAASAARPREQGAEYLFQEMALPD
ncbi:murein L,D-transpeptidase catalytic domain family protein [Denitratimonas tolerans]|jgi:hypothetical protein